MTIREGVGYQQLLDEAGEEVETIAAEVLKDQLDSADLVVVDLRDVRELQREGQIPGAVHMPRGMLEFWIDPQSPYHRTIFAEDKRFVFYCKSGWRSALAAQVAQRMGLQSVCHLEGGFSDWCQSEGAVQPYAKRTSDK
jgi:rhodanese-related sulfurtransferase